MSLIAGMTKEQVRLLLEKVEISGEGESSPPPLDLDAIQARADRLDAKSQSKADIYTLLIEVRKLHGNS